MKKIITLFVFITSIVLSSFSTATNIGDIEPKPITSTEEYDGILYMGARQGARVIVGITIPSNTYVGHPMWLDVDTSSGDIVLTLDYEFWQNFGAPSEEIIYVRLPAPMPDPDEYPRQDLRFLLKIG